MTIEFYQQLSEALQRGAVAIATVIQGRGSVPREVGAKMLIDADGQTFGTIGGGAGEAKVMQQAQNVLQTGESAWVEIDLSGATDRPVEGVCGGWMRVWIQRWAGSGARAIAQQICDRLQSGRPILLVIPLGNGLPYLVEPTQEQAIASPWLEGQQNEASWAERSDAFQEGTERFVEPLQPPPLLLIVGAGHVGVALARVAREMGWAIAVQDDRPNFTNAQHFPPHTQLLPFPLSLHHPNAADTLRQLTHPSRLHIALVTRGYSHDVESLSLLWHLHPEFSPHYIGMIGSKKRVRHVLQTLQNQGIPPNWLHTLHAPIGLEIGALTPTEIAISICAELISVRRQK